MNAIESVIVYGDIFGSGGESKGAGGYPAYAKTEKNAVATRLTSIIASIVNPIVIGFSTDHHLVANPTSEWSEKSRNEIAYGIRGLRDLTKTFNFDLVVLGGDTHGSTLGTIAAMQDATEYVAKQINGVNAPYIMLVGNHEGGQDNQAITRDQVYASHVTKSQINNIIIPTDRTSGYMDIADKNVRIVFIDAYPRPVSAGYSVADINTELASILSSMPNGYKAIIFSHHPIDENLPQDTVEHKLWNNPTACHATLQTYKDKIIACINGHVHNNLTEVVDGVRFISTTCAGRYELNDGTTRPFGAADATAFDVFVFDQTNQKIYAIRYGMGEDREFSYGDEPVVPRGNIIDETTWMDGKRLNSSGELVDQSGYSTTGLIENVNFGDTLYFADGVCPLGTTSMDLYDDSGTKIGTTTPISAETYGATYDATKFYCGCFNSSDAKVISYHWRGCLIAKGTGETQQYLATEFTFWESGFVKSCKLGATGHYTSTAKVRFTFPTAKKADVDIRVNEPFEEA